MTGVLEVLGNLAHQRVEAARAVRPEAALLARAAGQGPARDVLASLARGGRPALVAEFKRASPSAGAIAPAADPVETARTYERAGAAMISVLTEPTRFHGSLDDLTRVRAATSLPVLQKDFVVDPYQLLEARAAGADAVLLIVALVGRDLAPLLGRAHELGLTALVEAHTAAELDQAIASGARLIGVNNRDLATLAVDTRLAERLLGRVPTDRFALAESGLSSPAAVARAVRGGADGVLVGEYLMRSADPAAAAEALRGAGRRFVKVCGITRREDAAAAVAAGADAVGFVFAPSPRRVEAEAVRRLGDGLGAARYGVFVGASLAAILDTVRRAALTGVQLHDGAPDAAAAAALRDEGLDVLVAVDQASPGAAESLDAIARAGALPLLDARTGARPDGRSGRLDLERAAVLKAGVRRLALAGGLGPESVGEAVARVDPYGVDVSGGVEASPGVKDAALVRAFVRAARAAGDRAAAAAR